MTTVIAIDSYTSFRICRHQDIVAVTLVVGSSGNTFVLEVPIGNDLDTLAETLMYYSLAEKTAQRRGW